MFPLDRHSMFQQYTTSLCHVFVMVIERPLLCSDDYAAAVLPYGWLWTFCE